MKLTPEERRHRAERRELQQSMRSRTYSSAVLLRSVVRAGHSDAAEIARFAGQVADAVDAEHNALARFDAGVPVCFCTEEAPST